MRERVGCWLMGVSRWMWLTMRPGSRQSKSLVKKTFSSDLYDLPRNHVRRSAYHVSGSPQGFQVDCL